MPKKLKKLLGPVNKGQTLVELMLAMAIFIILAGSVSFLIFNSYTAGRLSKQMTKANFLAEEATSSPEIPGIGSSLEG